jgi:hypothetical protein
MADTVARRRAASALALVACVLVLCGCDSADGRWSRADGGFSDASPPAVHGAAVAAPPVGDGIQVAMAAPAVTDAATGLDEKVGASAGMKHLAQGSNQLPADQQRSPSPAPLVKERRPLVVIRFDRPDVPYGPALYTALSRALERRPTAMFDLVAVSPLSGSEVETAKGADEAQRDAERVMRTLSEMGLPADRVTFSAMFSNDIRNSEVRIFVH